MLLWAGDINGASVWTEEGNCWSGFVTTLIHCPQYSVFSSIQQWSEPSQRLGLRENFILQLGWTGQSHCIDLVQGLAVESDDQCFKTTLDHQLIIFSQWIDYC